MALQARLEEVMKDLPAFPATLTLREQGYFVLGYYHERAASIAAARQRQADRQASEQAADPEADNDDQT